MRISDPRPDLDELVARNLAGLNIATTADLAEAAEGTDYVQEAGPERIELKRELFATLAAHTRDDVVLASSSSSLLPSDIAEGNPAADRILVGHPFNPPQLMPLIEVVPSPQTRTDIVDHAVSVYTELGRVPIRLHKEIPGFVGNRLQKVFNAEATYLVQQGVIDVGDLDELVKTSLGLRWSTIGPFESQQLGGGPGGMRHLYENVGSQMRFSAGTVDATAMDEVFDEVDAVYGNGEQSYRALAADRDARTAAVLQALREVGQDPDPA